MAEFDTEVRILPVTLEARVSRQSPSSTAQDANFLSQLIAARAHLPPQRERRRATPQGAVGAYAAGARIAVRRMPAGYRTTIVA